MEFEPMLYSSAFTAQYRVTKTSLLPASFAFFVHNGVCSWNAESLAACVGNVLNLYLSKYSVLAYLEVLATDGGFGNLVKKSCLILDYTV